MNVEDLIDLLKTLNPKMPVILAGDEEGNDFHWLSDWGTGFIKEGTAHLYHIYDSEEIKDERDAAEKHNDAVPEFIPVFVLWP